MLGQSGGLRAHSIRGMSASAAFMRNQSVSKVLEAATWRSNSVFSSFYFKDICFSLGEWSSLGPLWWLGQWLLHDLDLFFYGFG